MNDLLNLGMIKTNNAVTNIAAQGEFDPGVSVQSDAPFLPALRDVGGWAMAGGLVLIVIVVVIGGVLIATGYLSTAPGQKTKGFWVLLFSLIGAAVIAGAGAWVRFGSGMDLTGAQPGLISTSMLSMLDSR